MPVIPYPRNQKKGVRGVLRIDRKFRSHSPQELRRAYKKRAAVERAKLKGDSCQGYLLRCSFYVVLVNLKASCSQTLKQFKTVRSPGHEDLSPTELALSRAWETLSECEFLDGKKLFYRRCAQPCFSEG